VSLTFRKIAGTDQRRADGENLSYVIVRMPKGWLLTVYSQNVLNFQSDNTTLVMLKDPVEDHNDDLLRDAQAVANAFETSTFNQPFDTRRRMADAVERAYRGLGYTR
jgi:hypothetical protein